MSENISIQSKVTIVYIKYEVDSYDENGAKKSEFISSLSENAYDEHIAAKDENMAKSICALAGFYKGMDPNLPSISAPFK